MGADRALATGNPERRATTDDWRTCLQLLGVVDVIFYLLQAGGQWRMLPRGFPPRSTVYGYVRAWIAAGVWAHVHDVLYSRTRDWEGRDESSTAAINDSQSSKTGPEAREMVGNAGKRVKGPQVAPDHRHSLPDVRIEVHSASVQDRDDASLVLGRITQGFPFLERIFADDAGYREPRVAAAAPRSVEIIRRTDTGFVVQPRRWVIERTVACACINRSLARHVERAAETVRALFQIVMIKLRSRRIARFGEF